jgi:hypothetical protein
VAGFVPRETSFNILQESILDLISVDRPGPG